MQEHLEQAKLVVPIRSAAARALNCAINDFEDALKQAHLKMTTTVPIDPEHTLEWSNFESTGWRLYVRSDGQVHELTGAPLCIRGAASAQTEALVQAIGANIHAQALELQLACDTVDRVTVALLKGA